MAFEGLIGALRISLGMDSAAFEKGATAAEKRMKTMQKRIGRIGSNFKNVGASLSIGLTAPLAGIAATSVRAAQSQERAVAAVDAALASMGQTAGFTSDELQKMAADLQKNSLFGDEQILTGVTANLLTFGNISGEVFERAQQSALDLSARLGTDLQSSTIQLGKALNDPVAGITALSRVGVSFTEQQKEQIKAMSEAGDVAEAQALILAELEKQYSGQAQALADTDSGKLTQSINRLGDASERVGAIVLPVLADLADVVASLAERFSGLSPTMQKFIVAGGALAAAIGPLAIGFGAIVTSVGAFLPVIAAVASPVGLAAAAIVGLGVAAVKLYENWDQVTEFFRGLPERLGALSRQAVDSFIEGLRTIIARAGEIIDDLKSAISAKIKGLGGDMLQAGKDVAAGLGEGIKSGVGRVTDSAKGLASGVAGAVTGFFETQSPSKLFRRIGGFLVDGLVLGIDGNARDAIGSARSLGEEVGAAANEGISATLGSLADAFRRGGIGGLIGELQGSASGAFSDLFKSSFASGGGGFGGLVSGLGASISTGVQSLGSIFSGGGLAALGSGIGAFLPAVGALTASVGLIKGFLGSSRTIGTGFQIGIEDGELFGNQFKRREKTKAFGLSTSTKTTFSDFDDAVAEALSGEIDRVQSVVRDVFSELGVTVSDGALAGVDLALKTIETRGLSEAEIQARFAEVFAEYGDALAGAVGDVSLEAATRLRDVAAVLEPAGQSFFGAIDVMATAAEDLAARAGGVGALSGSVVRFADLFFTEAEKFDVITARVSETFAELGLAVPKTNTAFKELVLSQNLMTEAGREAYAALLNIAPQFDAIAGGLSFGAFDLAQKRFETAFEDQVLQVAQARNFSLEQVAAIAGGAVDGFDSPMDYQKRMSETLDRIEQLGIPERG